MPYVGWHKALYLAISPSAIVTCSRNTLTNSSIILSSASSSGDLGISTGFSSSVLAPFLFSFVCWTYCTTSCSSSAFSGMSKGGSGPEKANFWAVISRIYEFVGQLRANLFRYAKSLKARTRSSLVNKSAALRCSSASSSFRSRVESFLGLLYPTTVSSSKSPSLLNISSTMKMPWTATSISG